MRAQVLAAGLTQPDQRSCGPSVAVLARMLADRAFAARVLADGSFAAEVAAAHRRAASVVLSGRPQVPWPRFLGTSPWALARLMSGSLRPGSRRRYRTRLIGWRRESAYVAISDDVMAGRVVPLYIGSRRLPRHVVLAVAHDRDGLRVYDPARGQVVALPRDAFVAGTLAVSGWTRPWLALLPRR